MVAIEGAREADEDVARLSLSISVVIQKQFWPRGSRSRVLNLAPPPPSGQERRRVHLHPPRARRGQVWLREAGGALAAHPHGGDHHDQRHLHAGRPQQRLSG